MIFQNTYSFNIFGAPVFHGYYTIHDPVLNTIGFVPTPGSPKKRMPIGEIPKQFFTAPL
jgi:hypothetical protein